MRSIFIAVITVILAMPAAADETQVQLKKATGLDKVEANCSACHSLDYIPANSPFLNPQGWDAEIAKMINAFGAPIDQADAEAIADYLNNNYGTTEAIRLPVSPPPRSVSRPSRKHIHFTTASLRTWYFGLPRWRGPGSHRSR